MFGPHKRQEVGSSSVTARNGKPQQQRQRVEEEGRRAKRGKMDTKCAKFEPIAVDGLHIIAADIPTPSCEKTMTSHVA